MIPCETCIEEAIYNVILMSLEKLLEFMKAWCPTLHHVKPHNAMNGSEVLMKLCQISLGVIDTMAAIVWKHTEYFSVTDGVERMLF